MEHHHIEDYLRLFHSRQLPQSIFPRLLASFGTVEKITAQTTADLLALGVTPEQEKILKAVKNERSTAIEVLKDLKWSDNVTNSIVCYESAQYPALLRELPVPPPLLYVVGNKQSISHMMIAIVGSRKSSAYGDRNAYWMAHELGIAGLAICSGLARGIDGQAHAGALAADAITVAVMGTGADAIYPAANQRLADQITEQGALVSEFPLGTLPLPQNFPRRNRIISGLCHGALVVEATIKSGSLITARTALEQNRDVFAIPGSISSQSSGGCHHLIKEGAKLVECPEDVLDELKLPEPLPTPSGNAVTSDGGEDQLPGHIVTEHHKIILQALETGGCLVDTLLDLTGLELQQLNCELLQLEIQGEIEAIGGRYVRAH